MSWPKPSPTGASALAELEKMSLLKSVITQNIDNLHQKAGSKSVLDYHGNISLLRCFSCDTRFDPVEYELDYWGRPPASLLQKDAAVF